jgi:peptidoglycan/LPS O-acetylase OafA/YrhL
MRDTTPIAYRPDIDGLRAVAVASVVAYHAAPALAPGGYIGVDVFFVISGFLISTIIMRERAAGHFSLAGFYGRRIRRLFPALIVVLAATLAIGWYFLLPHEFAALGKHVAAGAAYFLNFTLKGEAGYFDAAADTKPLLHLWSLAVEEQFYIVWPLLLLLIRDRRHLAIALVVITGVSFALGMNAIGRNQASAFYLPQNRVWELSLGALLAFAALNGAGAKAWLHARLESVRLSTGVLASMMSCAGLALIVGGVFLFDERVIYPGAWALIPTLGAVLVIAAGAGGLPNRLLLSQRAVVLVGLISYSLYLWHWPLLSFRSILGLEDDWRVTAAIVAISAGLAVATYYLVEQPFRRAKAPALTRTLAGVTFSFLLVGVLAYTSVLGPRLNSFQHQQIGAAINDWHYPDGMERVTSSSGIRVYRKGEGHETILYFGDSNIEQYWPRVERLMGEADGAKSVVFATMGGCPPIPGLRVKTQPICDGFAEKGLDIARGDDITTVVIAASWIGYFNNSTFYLEGDGGGRMTVGSHAWNKAFDNLAAAIGDLVGRGKSVWLVLNIPSSPTLTPVLRLRRSVTGDTSFVPLQLDRAAFDKTWVPIKKKLIAVAEQSGAGIIDPMRALCDNEICRGLTPEGAPIYTDGGHLRSSYVREHAGFLDATLGIATGSTR